ncbi:MAG: hypothetical protein ACQEXJ_20830 [Myxococcota bacterium]
MSPRRVWAGRVALLLFLAGGLILWRLMEPVETFVAFDVPPTTPTGEGPPLTRRALRGIEGQVLDPDGEAVARVQLDLPTGVRGPTTPPVVLRLPRDDYRMSLRLVGRSGQLVERDLALTIEDAGYRRVDLE